MDLVTSTEITKRASLPLFVPLFGCNPDGKTGSFSLWAYPDPLTGDRAPFGRYWFGHSVFPRNVWGTHWYWLGRWNYNQFSTGQDTALNQTWQHVAVTYDGSLGSANVKVYVNGVYKASDDETQDVLYENWAWQIGAHGNSAYEWVGDVDEVRLYKETLSADWIKFEYRNMAEADNELTWAAEEEAPDPEVSPLSDLIGNPYMFTGRRFDLETGLYYYRARYYNPQIGRFLQTDPARQGMNLYNYCANNPVNCSDPSGREWSTLTNQTDLWLQDHPMSCVPATMVNMYMELMCRYGKKYEDKYRSKLTEIKEAYWRGQLSKYTWGEKGTGVTDLNDVVTVFNAYLGSIDKDHILPRFKLLKAKAWKSENVYEAVNKIGPVLFARQFCGYIAVDVLVNGKPTGAKKKIPASFLHAVCITSKSDLWSRHYGKDTYVIADSLVPYYCGLFDLKEYWNNVSAYDHPIIVPTWEERDKKNKK